MSLTDAQSAEIAKLTRGVPIPDAKVLEVFPRAAGAIVPPKPNHVLYDLRIPAFANKLVVLGPVLSPLLWFTWCRPLTPIVPPVTGQHWIWVEQGPLFWVVDLWFERSVLSAKTASKLAFSAGLEMGIVKPGEDVLFYRDPQGRKPGRYGRMRVPDSR